MGSGAPGLEEELGQIVGKDHVLSTSLASLERCIYGSPPNLHNLTYRRQPERMRSAPTIPLLVVRPASTAEVSKAMKLANNRKVPIVPWGGGSNLVAETVPGKGWIVLDMSRLSRIVKIEDRHLYATVEPGVKLAHLLETLGNFGLRQHIMPGSARWATVGGAIASSARTDSCFRYGTIAKEILELEFVTPTGEVVRTGPWRGAGLDLKGLLINSEGTLGVITSATIRVHRIPPFHRRMCFKFERFAEAVEASHEIWYSEQSALSTLICFDRADRYPGFGSPVALRDFDGWLALVLEGTRASVADGMSYARRVVRAHGGLALEQKLVDSVDEWPVIFGGANSVEEVKTGIVDRKPWRFAQSVWVPPRQVVEIRDAFKESATKQGSDYDGCSYRPTRINLGLRCDVYSRRQVERARRTLRDFRTVVHASGATMARVHGLAYREEGREVPGSNGSQLMKRIKGAIDPNRIMKPGKFFD